jgi:hypothetical protein
MCSAGFIDFVSSTETAEVGNIYEVDGREEKQNK